MLTIVGAAFVHLGLNVANDVFDTAQGADDANVTPTQFSGGSRVIQYGLVSLRRMAIDLGGLLRRRRRDRAAAARAARLAGAARRSACSASSSPSATPRPPLKLVYRGLGELAVAIGFGPLMLLGAYVVQTGGTVAWEPFVASIPVALLVALILYVNEIPDRRGDAHAGKRTLPVRFSQVTIVTGYLVAAAAAFLIGRRRGRRRRPAAGRRSSRSWPCRYAARVYRGLGIAYDQPYVLMGYMGTNIRLHLTVGGLLLLAYATVLVVGALAPSAPLYLPFGLGR